MSKKSACSVRQALDEATAKLKKIDSQTPALDAEVLLAHALGKSKEYILINPEHELSPKLAASYKSLIARRSKGEPVAYLTGRKEFFGLDFIVNKDVLIPRPETELMVEEALHLLRSMLRNMLRNNKIYIVDVGTGSGNIIVSIAKKLDQDLGTMNYEYFAVDSSRKSLDIARQNAKKHDIEDKITFLPGRFLNPFVQNFETSPWASLADTDPGRRPFLLVLANLPYLSEMIYSSSPTSVKNFEPKDALLSGVDGLENYRKLFNQIKMLDKDLRLQVTTFCEISPEQKSAIVKEIKKIFPGSKISLKQDLAGKWRLVKFQIG